MVYRNDVDALEARLTNIQAELDAKTRARDEARQLVAEARARAESDRVAHDWATGGPQRRRSKRIKIAIGAALMLATAVIGIALKLRSRDTASEKFEKVMDTFVAFTDDLCVCTDTKCVQTVSDRMAKWATEMAKDPAPMQDMTSDQKERVQKIAERMSTCMSKAMSNESHSYRSQGGGQ